MRRALLLSAAIASGSVLAIAQSNPPATYSDSGTASANSRVLSAADSQISLGPEQIVDLLRRDPGLLLASKRILVTKAYEQGRLLNESELTDDALYRLIYADSNIRSLITKELLERHAVTVPQTDEEKERERLRDMQLRHAEAQIERAQADQDAAIDQEQHPERRASRARTSGEDLRNQAPVQSQPQTRPDGSLPSVRPDELPGLLRTSSPNPASGGARGSAAQTSSLGSGMALGQMGVPVSPSDALAQELSSGTGQSNMAMVDAGVPRMGSSSIYSNRERNNADRRNMEAADQAVASPIVHAPSPYSDVPALIDLYTQVSRPMKLDRFGIDLFRNGTGNFEDLPMDMPVGPDYVVGPGDGLNIELWGGVSQRLQRVVDRQGRVALPEIGTVMVAGQPLGKVQQMLQDQLRTEFRDVRADVSLSRLRAVRVYVVGDVAEPGPYDISALSTPLNAVFTAGGPTGRGSVRLIRHYRAKQLVQEIDSYDLLLHGVRSDLQPMQPGDTIMVPPLQDEITMDGMVRRPARYELHGERNLQDALDLAGGVLPTGTLRHIEVERLVAHEKRTMLSLDINEQQPQDVARALQSFAIQPGDTVRISAILPSETAAVYLQGHVFRPGKYAYRDGMHVSELIHDYKELMPEPYVRHAEIVRLNPPDYKPEVIAFNLADAMAGKAASNLVLKPLDTVRVFGRFDFEDYPSVTVSGEVRSPGEHRTSGQLRVRDAVYLAGGVTQDALLSDAQIFRRDNGKVQVMNVNLDRALNGDEVENVLLQPKDRIVIHRNLAKLDPPAVYIQGEVAKPGRYPLGENMTAVQLVRAAGGMLRGAYSDVADLSRFTQDKEKMSGERMEVEIARAFADPSADVPLKEGDTLTIRQISGWKDMGAAITVKGEVVHPSTYGIAEGERLSDVLRRAGGFRPDAYPQGAVLERVQIREWEEQQRADMVRRLDQEQQTLKAASAKSPAEGAAAQGSFAQQQSYLISKIKDTPTVGRMVIKISGDIDRWKGTPADVEVRAGDVITVPKRPNFVMVSGQVFNPLAVTYRPGKSARWYLGQAGGANELANKKNIFVVRSDGSLIGNGGGLGWWNSDPLNVVLNPGDMVYVPEKFISSNSTLKSLSETAQIISSVALAASVALK